MPRILKIAFTTALLTCLVIGLLILQQEAESPHPSGSGNVLEQSFRAVVLCLLFFGLGPLILLLAACFTKRRLAAVIWAIAAAGVMATVIWLTLLAAGIASATSGSQAPTGSRSG